MRVIVTGSRGWQDWPTIAHRLGQLPAHSTIVHGGAKGADQMAARCASRLGLEVEPHLADWEMYGNSAGYRRNKDMALRGADLCLAFWDGDSPGTRQMIGVCREQGIPVEIIEEEA